MTEPSDSSPSLPYFPAPRARRDLHAMAPIAAPAAPVASAPLAAVAAPAHPVRHFERPEAAHVPSAYVAPAPVASRASAPPFAPLPAPVVTEADYRRELMKGALESHPLLLSRGWFWALLIGYPHVFGALVLVTGIALVLKHDWKPDFVNGPGAIVTGLGWIGCRFIPISRTRWRVGGILVALFSCIAVDAIVCALR